MADQTQRLEIATVRAEVGSNIVYLFANDAVGADQIPTQSGPIQNLKQVIQAIQEDASEKISISTTIYPTVAAGLAASADQEIFLVQSNDADEIYAVWKNEAGTAVNTGKTALSATAIQTALDASNEAAQAAEDAADVATTRTAGFLAPAATPPALRDNGLPLQPGDRYFNTSTQEEFIYKTGGWEANDSLEAIAQIESRIVFTPEAGATPRADLDGKISADWLPGLLVDQGDLEDLQQLKLEAIKPLANYSALKNYSGTAVAVRITQSGISGRFNVIEGGALSEVNGMIIVDAIGRTWLREYYGDVFDTWFGVKANDSSAAVALSNAMAINIACDFIGQIFPGKLVLSAGTIFLTNTNPSAGSWDNRRAIYLRYSHIPIAGRGVGNLGTKLKLIDGANCHVIKIGAKAEYEVSVKGCSVSFLEIDGSRETQATPTASTNHFGGIAISDNCPYTVLEDLYVHDCAYYAIGMGREGLDYCRGERLVLMRTGADCLDWKNDSGNQVGGVLRHVTVGDFGLLPMSNVQTAQAGVDVRSGVDLEDIIVKDMNGESGLVGIRLQNGTTEISTADQPSKLGKHRVFGSGRTESIGVRGISSGSVFEDGIVTGCGEAYSWSNVGCRQSRLTAKSCRVGFKYWISASGTKASNNTASGLSAESCTQAAVVLDGVSDVNIFGSDIFNNAAGYDIRAGTKNTRIFGGSLTGNVAPLINSGESTVIESVSGMRTKQRIISTIFSVGSVAVRLVTVTHYLNVTPSLSDIQVTAVKETDVDDYRFGRISIKSVSATQIVIEVPVSVASANTSATSRLSVSVSCLSS